MPISAKINSLSERLAFSRADEAVGELKYRQCRRCVMDTTDREITFDADGYCDHCNLYLQRRSVHGYRGKASDLALLSIFEEIRSAGRQSKYDCVIGISGGVDSSYLAYLAVENGLKPLAVHLDNGWDSEKAVLNIRNVTRA